MVIHPFSLKPKTPEKNFNLPENKEFLVEYIEIICGPDVLMEIGEGLKGPVWKELN